MTVKNPSWPSGFETTVRCIPLPDQIPAEATGNGTCILTGKPSAQRVVMARAY